MDVPRRLPPDAAKRLKTIADHTAGGSLRGSTAWGKRTAPIRAGAGSSVVGEIVVIRHGDDSTVDRPVAAVVYWIGAATPDNAEPFDFWYTATI